MRMPDGDILPGKGIGNIELGITRKELLDIIGEDAEECDNIISIENAKFWIEEDGRLNQIGVGGDFKGKYKKRIGIGSTLSDVIKYFGAYKYFGYAYEIEQEYGMGFELKDVEDYDDEWDELTASIEYIYVFRIDWVYSSAMENC